MRSRVMEMLKVLLLGHVLCFFALWPSLCSCIYRLQKRKDKMGAGEYDMVGETVFFVALVLFR